jgi:hypothetical protein
VPLSPSDWLVVFPLMLVPAVVAEINKAILLYQAQRQREAEAAA